MACAPPPLWPYCAYPEYPEYPGYPSYSEYPPTYHMQVVETGFPEFATFSVGEDTERRTVVCFQQQLIDFTLGLTTWEQALPTMGEGMGDVAGGAGNGSLDSDFDEIGEHQPANGESLHANSDSATHPHGGTSPHRRSPGGESPPNFRGDCSRPAASAAPAPARRAVAPGRRRRPERAVYVPPSRSASHPLNPAAAPFISPPTSPTRVGSDGQQGLNPCASPWVSPPTSPCRSPPPPTTLPQPPRFKGKKPDRGVYKPPRGSRGRGRQVQGNLGVEPVKPGGDSPTSSSPVGSPDPSREDVEGEDVTEQVVAEITAAVGGVQIEAPIIDYLSFRTSDSTINIDQFGHVIELYDFPGHFTTPNLMAAFSTSSSKWDIKWVDDTHALGVFSSPEAASEALAAPSNPTVKSRPLNMATTQSKLKAKSVCDLLLPYKARPATSTAPARRLLQWALGSDKKVPAASKVEQDRLREAIKNKEEERKRKRREMREEAGGREAEKKREMKQEKEEKINVREEGGVKNEEDR